MYDGWEFTPSSANFFVSQILFERHALPCQWHSEKIFTSLLPSQSISVNSLHDFGMKKQLLLTLLINWRVVQWPIRDLCIPPLRDHFFMDNEDYSQEKPCTILCLTNHHGIVSWLASGHRTRWRVPDIGVPLVIIHWYRWFFHGYPPTSELGDPRSFSRNPQLQL